MPLPLYIGILVLSVSVGVPAIMRLVSWLSKRKKKTESPAVANTDSQHATAESIRADFRADLRDKTKRIEGDAELSRAQESLKQCEEEKRRLRVQVDTPPQYKLVIHSASYGSGNTFKPVDQYLRKHATDALSACVDANLFDAYDPTPDSEKDLTVVYSFEDETKHTIERHEKDWLALPDDPEFCFAGLQRRIMKLARALRRLILSNPPPPQATHALLPEESTAQMLKYNEWNNRLAYCYDSDFAERVLKVKNAIGRKNPNLAAKLKPIPGASPPPSMFPDLAKVLWDLAWEIEEIQSEKTRI